MNVSRARHLTFDFVNDVFTSVTRRKTRNMTKTDNTGEVEVTAIAEENILNIENTEVTVM